MPNKNYLKGYRLENKLVNDFKKRPGCVYAARIAGSHSPFDVIAIVNNELHLVQCKAGKYSDNQATIIKAFLKMPYIPDNLIVKKWIKTPDRRLS